MYVRVNLVTADPGRLDASVEHVRSTVMPLVLSLPGNRGIIMAANRETGDSVVATIWESLDNLRESEDRVSGVRADAGRIAGATPNVSVFEVAEVHTRIEPSAGCWQRATVLDVDPEDVDGAVETFRTSTVPALDSIEGFCAAVMHVDREAGRAVAITTWRSRADMEASRERATTLRQEVSDKAHGRVVSVQEREVVLVRFQ